MVTSEDLLIFSTLPKAKNIFALEMRYKIGNTADFPSLNLQQQIHIKLCRLGVTDFYCKLAKTNKLM